MTAIGCMMIGAAIGAVIAIALYVLGFGIELVNCACEIVTCNFDSDDAIPGMWESDTFVKVLIICIVAGAIIGLCYGLYKMKLEAAEEAAKRNEENTKEAMEKRKQWAEKIKSQALNDTSRCNEVYLFPLVRTSYKADQQMEEILKELSKIEELRGKVNSMANEIEQKGGAAL